MEPDPNTDTDPQRDIFPASATAPPDPQRLRDRLAGPTVRRTLLRYCVGLTGGDAEAAEDLAQETLLDALARAHLLYDPDAVTPWLLAAARIHGMRRHRRVAKNDARQISMDVFDEPGAMASPPTALSPGRPPRLSVPAWDWDPLEPLAREEMTALVDRALGRLPEAARRLLIAHYLEERIGGQCDAGSDAGNHGQGGDTRPGSAASSAGSSEPESASGSLGGSTRVRLYRARVALRRVLEAELRAEATAQGLFLDAAAPRWQPGPVWRFRCGAARMEYRFERGDGVGFAVRCPRCDASGPERIAFSTDHPHCDAAAVLGNVQGCKPALTRVNAWWHAQLQRGITTGTMGCHLCGERMTFIPPPPAPPRQTDGEVGHMGAS